MADEIEKPQEEKVRGTISQTHKQAFLSYGSTAVLAAVLSGPLSKFFQTKEDAAKQGTSIAVQATQIADLKTAIDANKTDIINAVNSVMKPIAQEQEHHETRIVNLEFLQMQKGVKK